MERQKEIETLQSLKGGTYFHQIFPDSVIDAMCENIRMDFPVDMNIEMFSNCHEAFMAREEAKKLRGQLDEANNMLADLREQKNAMADFLIELEANLTQPMREIVAKKVIDLIGSKETIKRKLKIGVGLTEEEKDWLINNL